MYIERKAILRHITGSTITKKHHIRVDFMKDEHGAITAQTCGNLIILPRGAFSPTEVSYSTFKAAMKAVISPGMKSFCLECLE